MSELVLQVNSKIHILRRMNDNINELHAGDHEINIKIELIRVSPKIVHECFESINLLVDVLEIIECAQNDRMAAIDQTHGGQELENERFGSVLFVFERERY
jgi:hypothetical protein